MQIQSILRQALSSRLHSVTLNAQGSHTASATLLPHPPLCLLGPPFIKVILDLLDPPGSRYGVFLIPFLDLALVTLDP